MSRRVESKRVAENRTDLPASARSMAGTTEFRSLTNGHMATAAQQKAWHQISIEETIALSEVDASVGLASSEISARLDRYGSNEIQEQRRRGPARMLLDQFTDFMILVLFAAAIISGVIGEAHDTIAILVIVVLNAVIGFVQEYRAERALAALRRMSAPSARVRRDGSVVSIAPTELVPGDIVLLEAGNVISADLRLLEVAQLKVEEAALTGESQPVEKRTDAFSDPDLLLGDRANMAYRGTVVTYGRGVGVVVATGMQTELGKIAALLGKEEGLKTPLQRRLARFGRRLAVAVLIICGVIFVAGLLRGEPVALMLLTAVSLAVAAIPEALPALVTISLALGARKLIRQNALIRHLPAVETLGSVTYICSDKTGTLTQNKMHAEVFYIGGTLQHGVADGRAASGEPENLFYQALALNNDALIGEQDDDLLGDPTEIALYRAARDAGWDREAVQRQMPRVAEIPFDSERKRMTTVHRQEDAALVFTKGAPEQLLEQCTHTLTATGLQPLDRGIVLEEAEQLAGQGYRVLAFAYRSWQAIPAELTPQAVETGLTFLGLTGLMDPPRPEVEEAVHVCKTAGITPVMITGDHPATARAIAQRLGIIEDSEGVLTGRDLDRVSLEELEQTVREVRVYSRVAPEQKIKIVKALQDTGEYVAMTGDGVNDAPALKRANIGVAMGQTGTDVARQAAHMVLLDDNFATIVYTIREGRRIFDNIRKFIKYTMTSNSGEIWTLFLAPFLGLPIPLLPIHILWINLITDGLPGLALTTEPKEPGVMERPPRPPNESVFSHGMWQHMIWVGLLIGGLSLSTQALAYHGGSSNWQTMVFTVLTVSQMFHVLAIRSEKESLFTIGIGTNKPLLGAVLLTLLLQLMVIYIPVFNPIFKTVPLTAGELAFCFVVASIVLPAVEVEKWMIRRGWLYREARHTAFEPRPSGENQ